MAILYVGSARPTRSPQLVQVLGSVVQIATLAVLRSGQAFTLRGPIATELVRDEYPRHLLTALE